MLGSANLGPSVFLGFYCHFVKSGPFVTKFSTDVATDNMNKHYKFGYCMITFRVSRRRSEMYIGHTP